MEGKRENECLRVCFSCHKNCCKNTLFLLIFILFILFFWWKAIYRSKSIMQRSDQSQAVFFIATYFVLTTCILFIIISFYSLRSWRDKRAECCMGQTHQKYWRRSREKNEYDSNWDPACSNSWAFWTVRLPDAREFRIGWEAMTRQTNVSLSQGKVHANISKMASAKTSPRRAQATRNL